jgi:hypothetical protein
VIDVGDDGDVPDVVLLVHARAELAGGDLNHREMKAGAQKVVTPRARRRMDL